MSQKVKKIIGIGEYAIGDQNTILVTLGLGSCVGVCIRDKSKQIGGMVHVMLPESGGKEVNKPGKYADTGITVVVNELKKLGGKNFEAKIAGGAAMFNNSAMNVGQRNVEAVKKILNKLGIKIVSEDTGGNRARSIEYDVETGKLMIRKVKTGENVEVIEI
ncbi:chemotaxis protein CheD [Thermosipho melanesiensis]|uniref:Probable chemoreceptor glutamine deamidase CheD n=2 Tax=Thermosipho melanesiensis TaxID=46541 RepID=A6LMX8_THEM4|nr:chemoreceptor glutamine deamidase/glutamate methylesterase CheD [Thermosipho melanesiensis]ABR31279.1 CheD, stimulates methylation of MCP proteins [Thermosipho melanesiensis BI429]APT74359.1 chemotaxis protein CheD [Thermosipho melanesiensis]OOC36302.1 chemotaxis protein CheD [Thermosipho melanesiensis]OOC37120.1 chemotaxis protein CheD [Thermosipho melanesiensis]OOC37872.1 chemotaxis protein CheD [Thermosipho melanesiensis]